MSTLKKTSLILISVICFIFLSQIYAISDVVCENGIPPEVVGEIKKGDFRKTIKCLSSFIESGPPKPYWSEELKLMLSEPGWIILNSVGGDVNEAIKFGRFFRESIAEVFIGDQCYSACSIAAFGTVSPGISPDNKMGLHRIFYDKATLKQTDIVEYQKNYNAIKEGMRRYCLDMDVPNSIMERLFSVSSEDLYILKNDEYDFLFIQPAYDEWIEAKCSNTLSKEEQEDFQRWFDYYVPNAAQYHDDKKSFFEKSPFSKGYTDYLEKKKNKHDDCVKKIRWDQFVKTVIKYNE
jgi:hypothetical protein